MSHSDIPAPTTTVDEQAETTIPSTGPSWQEQDGVLREMWLNNQTPQAISEALGRSVAAIMTRAARLGLPRRASPGRKPGQRRLHDQSGQYSGTVPPRATARASAASEAAPLPQTSLRVCLMCLNKFESLGRHNRICPTCRNSSEYESAASLPELHFSVS